MVERFEKFSYLITELSRLLHKIESDALSQFGIKGPYAIYILTLAKHPEGIPPLKIAELCARDKADVSRAIAALTERGLVTKQTVEGKKYRSPIALTENGLLLAKSISQKARAAVEFASGGVLDEDRKTFYETLEAICSNMTKMSLFGVPQDE